MIALLNRADRALAVVERAAIIAAAAILFAVMAIAAADVGMRYAIGEPFLWAHDLISLYLLPALFYLALSRTFRIHGHIGVDILQYALSDRGRHACQFAIGLLTAALFALITYSGVLRTVGEYADDSVTSGLIEWPTWPSVILVPIGCTLLALRALVHAGQHGAAMVTGRPLAELPPLAGEEESLLGPTA